MIVPKTKSKPTRPLTIWAISDGRAGIQNQVLGLAEALSRLTPCEISSRRMRYQKIFDFLPTALKIFPDRMLRKDGPPFSEPYPDIWIAAGRSTLPHSLRMRGRSRGQTLVVQLQNPRALLGAFDLVIAPEHDRLRGKNCLSLLGSTNRVSPIVLKKAYEKWASQIEALPHPRICALIGGNSKAFVMDAKTSRIMAEEIASAVKQSGGSLMLTISRRTPHEARIALTDALRGVPGIFYDGTGENPYFAFLHGADHFLISEDSVNMATEAAATGKPIQILGLTRKALGSGAKFVRFHDMLQARGISHPFNGTLSGAPYPPLNETDRAAREVLRVFHEKYPTRHLL